MQGHFVHQLSSLFREMFTRCSSGLRIWMSRQPRPLPDATGMKMACPLHVRDNGQLQSIMLGRKQQRQCSAV